MDTSINLELFGPDENLLPCIKCGGSAKLHTSFNQHMWTVKCNDCGNWSRYSHVDVEKAVGMWNMNNHPDRG